MKKTRFVYRIEDEEGIGPYMSYKFFSNDILDMAHSQKDKNGKYIHPGLCADLTLITKINTLTTKAHKKFLSGCKSVKGLKKWFDVWFDRIVQTGDFFVVRYEVPRYIEGVSRKRVFFRKDRVVNKKVVMAFEPDKD